MNGPMFSKAHRQTQADAMQDALRFSIAQKQTPRETETGSLFSLRLPI